MARQFLVEGAVVLGRQALPAVFLRETDAGKAAVEDLALQGPVARDGLQLLLVVLAVLAHVPALRRAEIGLDPRARAQAERLDAFHVLAHAAFS